MFGNIGPYINHSAFNSRTCDPQVSRLRHKWPLRDTPVHIALFCRCTHRDESQENLGLHKQSTGQTSTQSVYLHLIQFSPTIKVMDQSLLFAVILVAISDHRIFAAAL